MWTMIVCSVLCDIGIIGALFWLHWQNAAKAEDAERNTAVQIANAMNEQARVHD